MSAEVPIHLAEATTDALDRAMREATLRVAIVPVGSTEPHGPHLPLSTDVLIGEAAAERAAKTLRERGVFAVVAPAVPYGVTDFAQGFRGAVSVPADVLTAFLRAVVAGLLADGFDRVCLSSNHLEPAHDAAVRAAIVGREDRASVASPLTKRHGRRLTAEYKSGACHAGQYETSLVLAHRPDLVKDEVRAGLPVVPTSLSDGIREGKHTFKAMGLDAAYAGSPRDATREEGEVSLGVLADAIVVEVGVGDGAQPAR